VLVLLPVVTYPICLIILRSIPSCILDEENYKAGDIAWVLAPTALDLLPFAWLRLGDSRVRWSAGIAGVMGAVRFAIPAFFVIGDVLWVEESIEPPCEDYDIHLYMVVGIALIMPILWGISAILAVVAAFFTRPQRAQAAA
jgi:hypothetical protein